MIKLLVSDVDGTLFKEGYIDERDIGAIERAYSTGIQICLASGRMYPELQEISRQLNVDSHLVSQNGSFVHVRSGELLYAESFDLSMARQLMILAREQEFPYVVSCMDNQIYIPETACTSELRDRMFMPVVACTDIDSIFEKGILPCKFAFFGDLDLLNRLRMKFIDGYSNQIDTYIADRDCLDVMPHHVSKGRGLTALLRYLDITPAEMVCVGDAFNDLSMFELTPHSFAMHHSHPDVQKTTTRVVNSVADVVEWISSRD